MIILSVTTVMCAISARFKPFQLLAHLYRVSNFAVGLTFVRIS